MKKLAHSTKDVRAEARRPLAHVKWLEVGGIVALAGLAVFFLATSWRKWPDPLIDFGNGLYTAWRLSNGAVLYRDVSVDYGPLSQLLDGRLFAFFGSGVMVLVTANLIIFAAILSLIYILFRQAWGVLSAFVASAIFISAFAFSQSVVFGNYNYATPYSEETVYGVLICLVLVELLWRWVDEQTFWKTFGAGFLFGLTAVLKPEFMLGGAAIIAAAVVAARWQHGRISGQEVVWWGAIGAILPTALLSLYFSTFFNWGDALAATCHAWLSIAQLGGDMAQMLFLGLDHPWQNVGQQVVATFWAALFLAAIAGASWFAERRVHRTAGLWVLAGVILIAIGAPACFLIGWREVGRCLLGLVTAYVIYRGVAMYRYGACERRNPQSLRWLISILALVLLSRMILNCRIYQYGYYQAALAAILGPAVLLGEVPDRLSLQRCGRLFLLLGCVTLLLPGLVRVVADSQSLLRLKTASVADGVDRFYAYPAAINPQAEIVDRTATAVRNMAHVRSLLVLPEGAMINYLARCPSPVAQLLFYAGITENGGEEKVVSQLKQHPADVVVVITRDLRDYGIRRYGERVGAGRLIVQWVSQNYEIIGRVGDDPFASDQHGALMLRRKTAP